MKIRSAECLLFVAIVTSAAVMQIREYTLSAPQTNVTNEEAAPAQREYAGQAQACGNARSGLLPAACDTRRERRDERTIDSMEPQTKLPHTSKVWV
jgi:hypothetical protein